MIGFKAGLRTIHLPETDSTNSYAARLLHLEVPEEGTVIMADFQKAGRGQRGSGWESQIGKNMIISYILYPNFLKISDQFALNQTISLAVSEFVRKMIPAETFIKWPNDIISDGQKIAGVLVENSIRGNQITHSIIGIGININQTAFEMYSPPATSFKLLTQHDFDLKKCLLELNLSIEKYYNILRLSNFKKLNEDYSNSLFRLGKRNAFEADGKKFWGTIKGVNNEGKLQITDDDGNISMFMNKEVSYIF